MRQKNLIKNHKNWLGYYLAKLTGSLKKKGFTFHLRSGTSVEVSARMMHTYKECFLAEDYSHGFPEGINPFSGKTVVDVGANVGYFSLFALHKNPHLKIFAFEPIPNNFSLLSQYAKTFSQFDLRPRNEALSGKDGTLILHYNASDQFSTSASIHPNPNEPDRIEVPTWSLKSFFEKEKIDTLDLLKLDCEGAEYDILYSCPKKLLSKIRHLAIETHPGEKENHNLSGMAGFLAQNNFKHNIEGSMIWAWR